MNPNFVLQVGLATAMVVGAIATSAYLLRQSSIRRRSELAARPNLARGSNLQPAFGSEATAVEAVKRDESVLAVRPTDPAFHELNERVAKLHTQVELSTKLLMKLASPLRREIPSAEERKRADTQENERAATNAKMAEFAQQLRALTYQLATLKRAIEPPTKSAAAPRKPVETPKKPEARSTSEKPEARRTVEKPTTSPPADTQKLATLLRVMTAGSPPNPDGRQAPSPTGDAPPTWGVNPSTVGVRPAQGGTASPEKSGSELKAKPSRFVPRA